MQKTRRVARNAAARRRCGRVASALDSRDAAASRKARSPKREGAGVHGSAARRSRPRSRVRRQSSRSSRAAAAQRHGRRTASYARQARRCSGQGSASAAAVAVAGPARTGRTGGQRPDRQPSRPSGRPSAAAARPPGPAARGPGEAAQARALMTDFAGKHGLIVGVANKRSISWAIAQATASRGARLALTYQGRFEEHVNELVAGARRAGRSCCRATSSGCRYRRGVREDRSGIRRTRFRRARRGVRAA